MSELFWSGSEAGIGKFADRRDAGHRLASRLRELEWREPLVLGLVRGGVPVAAEVAARLHGELDAAVARKIGAPGNPEAAIGAVTPEGEPMFDERALRVLRLDEDALSEAVAAERERAVEQRRRFSRGVPVADRDVLVVDDGLATGLTACAALRDLRTRGPRSLVLAAPIASPEAVRGLCGGDADEIVTLDQPPDFRGVGQWYENFRQVPDEEVLAALRAPHGG